CDRVGPECGDRAVAREPLGAHQAQEPEAPRILEAEPGAVGECDARMNVGERLIALALGEQPAPAHPEVGEERDAALQLEDQELAEPRNTADRTAFEAAG